MAVSDCTAAAPPADYRASLVRDISANLESVMAFSVMQIGKYAEDREITYLAVGIEALAKASLALCEELELLYMQDRYIAKGEEGT